MTGDITTPPTSPVVKDIAGWVLWAALIVATIEMIAFLRTQREIADLQLMYLKSRDSDEWKEV